MRTPSSVHVVERYVAVVGNDAYAETRKQPTSGGWLLVFVGRNSQRMSLLSKQSQEMMRRPA
jgi:diadenosine tetraphosphate (Ap4A) HIT family hydrolase